MAINSAPLSAPIEVVGIGTAFATPRTRVQIKRYTNLSATDVTGKRVSGVFGRRTSGSAASSIQVVVHDTESDPGAKIATPAMSITDEGVGATYDPPVTFPGPLYFDAIADVGGDTWEFTLQFAD